MSEPQLPTEDDIKQLPRWARVAFAARCARRAQPLFKKHCPDAPEKHDIAIETAISLAEQFTVTDFTNAYSNAYYAAAYAYNADFTNAYDAAYAAAYAIGATHADADATHAIRRSHRAGVSLADIHRDFTTILELARKHTWDDNTPVPPSVFGPFEEPSKGYQLEVKLQVPANWTVEQIRDYVSTLSDRVDDVHRAAGGKGLKVCDLEILDDAVVTAGVRQ